MEKNENLHKELDMVQGIITRIANNSFLVKGWAMTLMSALIAFGKDTVLNSPNSVYYLYMMLGVIVPFWWLDAFYLRQERIFRQVYTKVIKDPDALNRLRYDLSSGNLSDSVNPVWKLMGTKFICWFYLPFILLILAGIVLKIYDMLTPVA